MAKLRVDKIASVGVSTETTGSVFFDNSGDYLVPPVDDDELILGDTYSVEWWHYLSAIGTGDKRHGFVMAASAETTTLNESGGLGIYTENDGSNQYIRVRANNTGSDVSTPAGSVLAGVWQHCAVQVNNNSCEIYIDGVLRVSGNTNGSVTQRIRRIGSVYFTNTDYDTQGYISNLRICKGHVVYTSNFTPPTRELEAHAGSVNDRTVLLCCYDGDNIFAEKTGRILRAVGDRLSSPTPTATDSPIGITTLSPGLVRDVDNTFGPVFQGGAGFTSQNWLTLPKGTTTERFPDFGAVDAASARGIWGAGTPSTNVIDYVTISTLGDAEDFGDMTAARQYMRGYGSQTRGLWAQSVTPVTNLIEFITISSTGDAQDFGDLTQDSQSGCWTGNSTRACAWQGRNPTENAITYVTIASMGNAEDFGDMTLGMRHTCGLQSSTRGIIAGGFSNQVPTNNTNVIQYITTASTGNAQDFGDVTLSGSFRGHASGGNSIRGVYGGGIGDSAVQNVLEFITMASLGNGTTFGELGFKGRQEAGGCSSSTRALFGGSYSPSTLSTINFVQIATTGDATTFGDLSEARGTGALSNGHGGLG